MREPTANAHGHGGGNGGGKRVARMEHMGTPRAEAGPLWLHKRRPAPTVGPTANLATVRARVVRCAAKRAVRNAWRNAWRNCGWETVAVIYIYMHTKGA